MSFLDTLKVALSSKVAQQVEAALPTVAADVAEVVVDPSKLISIFAELVSGELEKLFQSHAALAQSVSSIAETAGQAVQVAQTASDAVAAIVAAPAGASTIQTGVVDATELAANVFAALEPKLAPYTQAISLLAQHFPQLNAPVQTATAPAAQ